MTRVIVAFGQPNECGFLLRWLSVGVAAAAGGGCRGGYAPKYICCGVSHNTVSGQTDCGLSPFVAGRARIGKVTRYLTHRMAPGPTLPVIETPASQTPSARIRQWFARPENQLLLLLLLAAFPLYYELGRNPVHLWDESRVAANSAEMARNGHWLVPYYDGTPDHWNTKPPLLVWLQALCFKIFGYSTWSLRLPTLLATMGTVVVLFQFAATVLGRPRAGLLAGMVLVTSAGYLRMHVARTGDYDALLAFWQVLVFTQFFQYLETGARRYLVWLAVGLVAGTMTKGPAGLLAGPGLLVYALGRGKLLWLLRQPEIYVAAGVWAAVVGGYFFMREGVDPGYWQAVQHNDLGGRYLTALDGHFFPWDYYLESIQQRFFSPWLWIVGPALLVSVLQPARVVKRAAGLLAAFIVGWLVVISSAQSKLDWYDAPIYPALALMVGIGLNLVYEGVTGAYWPRLGRFAAWLVPAAAIVCVFYVPYHTIVRQLIEERHSDHGAGPDGYMGSYLTKLAHEQPQIDTLSLLSNGMQNSVLRYYKFEFEQTPGRSLTSIVGEGAQKLAPGAVVTICDPALRAPLDSVFQVIELHQDAPCQTVLLAQRR